MAQEFEKGVMFHKQGRISQAEDAYLRALSDDFDNAQLLYLLGTIYFQTKRFGLAAQLLRRATQLKANYFEVWNNLGNCYKATNKETDAKMCWEKALKIPGKSDQEYSDVYNNLSTLYVNAGNPKAGMPYVEKCLELNPKHADGNWNLTLLNLEQGEYAKGFDNYHWGIKTGNRQMRNYGDHIEMWDGSPGKRVIVWGEQGIGDEMLFASLIPDLAKISEEVVFDCHPRLVDIFKESFPGVACYGTRKDETINWVEKHPQINAKIPIGDLGKYFRRSLEDFPNHPGYLRAKPERIRHYINKLVKLGPRPKIGISWTGGYDKTRKDYRTVSLDKWEPILKQDADFISLQYTPEAYNIVSEIEDKFDVKIHHWPQSVQTTDYHETAALVSSLDLVITVNTAVHHLSGALGIPCWTMTPVAKAWRYWSPDKENKTIPWYPSVTQYQQEKLFEWGPVVERIAEDLKTLINNSETEEQAELCGSTLSV